jgi:hypothetical protein
MICEKFVFFCMRGLCRILQQNIIKESLKHGTIGSMMGGIIMLKEYGHQHQSNTDFHAESTDAINLVQFSMLERLQYERK